MMGDVDASTISAMVPKMYSPKRLKWEREREEKIRDMFAEWTPLKDRLERAFKADPNLNKREVLAKMFFDVAEASEDSGVILKALDAVRRMYGHDASTVTHKQDEGTIEERMQQYRKELMDQVLDDVKIIEGQVVVVAPEGKK